MTHTVLSLQAPGWTSGADGAVHLWSDPPRTLTPALLEDLAHHPQDVPGHWAAVDLRGGRTRLLVDPLRPRPLLFARAALRPSARPGLSPSARPGLSPSARPAATGAGESWVVSDDIGILLDLLPTPHRDSAQARIFADMGYTLGQGTLVRGVRGVPAGAAVTLGDEGATSRTFGAMVHAADGVEDPVEFTGLFEEALDTCFSRMLEATAGRQLVVPLSGGLDSRLVVLWLRRLGAADRVSTFTYGVPGSREVAVVRDVARALGVPLEVIGEDAAQVRSAWAGPDTDAFLRATWCGTSLPHVQDWFALSSLRERSLVDADAVFLPGHTVVGNMHDQHLLDVRPDRDTILATLAHEHGRLRGRPARLLYEQTFRDAADLALAEVGFDGSPASTQSALEWFNLRERQAKYITNSVRAYEAFGWSWALPMLDLEMRRVWARGGPGLTATRAWYAGLVADHHTRATGEHTRLHSLPALPGSALVPGGAGLRRRVAGVADALGVGAVVSRLRSVRAMRHHPMAFEAFTGGMPGVAVEARMLAGWTSTGFWARSFLADDWGGQGDIVPAE